MTENKGRGTGEGGGGGEGEGGGDDDEGKVTLLQSQYDALLDRLDELEGGKGGNDRDDVDDLVDEAKKGKGGKGKEGGEEGVDYDKLTNSQLVQALEKELTTNFVAPVMQQLNVIKLEMEVERLMNTQGYEKFDEYAEDIGKVIKDNPNLSLKKAYKLVESERGETEEGEKKRGGDKRGDRSSLRHLPPRGGRSKTGGAETHAERPGAPASATREKPPKTITDAASRAWDEVVGGREE